MRAAPPFLFVVTAAVAVGACEGESTKMWPGEPYGPPANQTKCEVPDAGMFTPTCAGPIPHGCASVCLFGCATGCDDGWMDCNGEPSDGCEINIASDSAHCGVCDATCNGACIDGACRTSVVVSTIAPRPQGIATDATAVYWMADGSLHRTPLAGGDVELLASGEYTEGGLAIDGSYVYWATRGYDYRENRITNTGQIRRVPIGGGAVETLLGGLNPGRGIAARDGVAYVASYPDASSPNSNVMSSANGGTFVAATNERNDAFALRGDRVVVVDGGGLLSVDAQGNGRVVLVPPGSGVAAPIASNGTAFFWVNRAGTSANDVMINDDAGTRVLAVLRRASVFALTADTTSVYAVAQVWESEGCILEGGRLANVLLRIDVSNGATTTLARVIYNSSFITSSGGIAPYVATDPTSVYWLAPGDAWIGGQLMRTPK